MTTYKDLKMKKYIVIEADINDGDYVTEKTEITDEQIIKIKEVLAKMPKVKDYKGNYLSSIRYETRDMGNDDKKDSDYQHISNEEKEFLTKFLPSGDYNYSGIHTIETVEIVQELEKLI